MDARLHPAYDEESARLADTAAAISAESERLRTRSYDGYTRLAAAPVARADRERLAQLELAGESPYFHRTDAVIDGAPQTIYIGKFPLSGLDGTQVVAWQADLAALRFSTERDQQVNAPGGTRSAVVALQRRIGARGRKLLEITDMVDYRHPTTLTPEQLSAQAEVAEREDIARRLGERATPGLHEIVETMQRRQDEIVRIPAGEVLVVDGSAGSGKTSIAYHRVAYLLFRWQQDAPERTPLPIVVFAPNNLFLSYVHNILPELGVDGIQETTFESWAMEHMGLSPRSYELIDPTFEQMLDARVDRENKRRLWQRSRLVSSEAMVELIRRYVPARAQEFEPAADFGITEFAEGRMLSLSITAETARAIKDRVFSQAGRPYADNRVLLLDLLVAELEDQISEQLSLSLAAQQHINEGAASRRTLLQTWLDEAMPPVRLLQDYYRLLKDEASLETLASDLFDAEERALIGAVPKRTASQIVREDLTPLLALYVETTGKVLAVHGHVVIDEAQDYSLAQLELIRRVCGTSSFTLLGDVAQGIYAYRGIDDWTPLQTLFSPAKVRIETVDVNYRSTDEIIGLANRVLESAYHGTRRKVAGVGRHGELPNVLTFNASDALYDHVAASIAADIEESKRQTVAVIGKTHRECAEAYRALEARGVDIRHNWVSEEGAYSGGVAILTANAAKGLEFESAYVVDADPARYSADTPYDARLLYVAVTRALDKLEVLAVGEVTRLLG